MEEAEAEAAAEAAAEEEWVNFAVEAEAILEAAAAAGKEAAAAAGEETATGIFEETAAAGVEMETGIEEVGVGVMTVFTIARTTILIPAAATAITTVMEGWFAIALIPAHITITNAHNGSLAIV